MLKKFVIGLCCTVLFWIAPVAAQSAGQLGDKKTTITFSAPVELPNMVLPAGTYVFKVLLMPGTRNVVQVFNADETHLYTTVLAIPNYRLTPKSETVMRFDERKSGSPEALRAWFYPTDSFGQEFVYPRQRASELAEATRVPVMTAPVRPAEKPEELAKERVVAVTPEKKEVEVAQVTGPPPVPARTPPPPVIAQAKPAPAPPPAAPPSELPKTASPLPLLILAGGSAAFLAVVLKLIARRVA